MSASGTWTGGYVDGWGYTFGDVVVTGSFGGSGNSNTAGSGSGNFGYDPNQWGGHGDPAFWGIPSGNQDYSGSNSGNWWEDIFNSGEAGGTYYGGGEGYYCGSSSGSNGSSSPGGSGSYGDEDPIIAKYRQPVEELIPLLISEIGKSGIDISNVPIEYLLGCSSNAVYHDGKIKICTKCLTEYEEGDIISIVLHEAIHNRDDIPANMTIHSLEQPFDFRDNDLPKVFDDFLRERSIIENEFLNSEYLEDVIVNEIRSPEYYQNEINAYKKEIELRPNVSAKYDVERRYMLWRSEQLYEHAKNNYPQ